MNQGHHRPSDDQEVNDTHVFNLSSTRGDDSVLATKEETMNQMTIDPIQAPGPGRPRQKGSVTAATKRNMSLREIVMEQASTDLKEQIASDPDVIAACVMMRDWFTRYWNAIDKRRLLENFVETVNQIEANPDGSK